jgi:hypothetical protein
MSPRKRMMADLELNRLLEVRYDTPFRHELSNKELEALVAATIHQLEEVTHGEELSLDSRAELLLQSWNTAIALLRRWAPPGVGNELRQRLSRAITLKSFEPISETYLTDEQRRRLIKALHDNTKSLIEIGMKFLTNRKVVKENPKIIELNPGVQEQLESDIRALLQNTLFGLKINDLGQ